MHITASAAIVGFSLLLASCATTVTSPNSAKVEGNSPIINPRAITDTEKAEVVQRGEMLYKEISGFWMGAATGQLSDFALTTVRLKGDVFVAHFFVKSTGRLDCSIDRQVFGVFDRSNQTLEFVMEGDIACIQNFLYRARFYLPEKKGEYLTGRKKLLGGAFIVKNVQ
ncbi:MAG: hypothetical protein AB7P37_20945 [Ramlibacter sp.]